MDSDGADGEPRRRPEPPPLEFVRTDEKGAPPAEPPRPAAWVTRPEEFEAARPRPARPTPTARTRRPALAGVCLLLAGVLGIAGTAVSILYPLPPGEIENITAGMDEATIAVLTLLAFLSLYAQAFALLGGVLALQRANWKLAVFCAAASVLTLGLFAFEGSVLGLLGLMLLLGSRGEFRS